MYSSNKEKITVNGNEIDATGYSVELTEKDAMNLIKAIVTSLAEDDDTIDLVVDKVNGFMELVGETQTISSRDVKSLLSMAESSLDTEGSLSEEKLKITVYDYKDQVVRISFSMADDAIILDSMTENDTTSMAIKLKADGEEMTLMNISSTKKGEGQYSTTLSMDLEGYKIEVTIDSEVSDSSEKADMKIYVDFPEVITVL